LGIFMPRSCAAFKMLVPAEHVMVFPSMDRVMLSK
jgi:hypothetical protein